MKIVHITPQLFRSGKLGGGERFVAELSEAQRDHHEVDVIIIDSYRGIRRSGLAGSDVDISVTLTSLKGLVKNADVLHIHQLNSIGADLILPIARWYKKRVVLTDHGGGFRAVGRLLGRIRYNFIDHFALVSEASARDLRLENSESYSIIWGGGDHVLRESRFLKSQPPSVPTFLFVGRLLPHKGLHILVEALSDGCRLRVAGEFRDPEYEEHVRCLATGKDVEFLGAVSDADLSQLYAQVSCTVVPSVEAFGKETYARPELLGLVALESLACGTPVIGSRVGGLGELLSWAGQFAVTPGDSNELRCAMASVLRNPPAVPQEDFSWGKVSEKCLEAYRGDERK